MANIVLLTADSTHRAATYAKSTLEALGHTVTYLLDSAVTSAASFNGYDLIFVARRTLTDATGAGYLRQAIDSGMPAVIGSVDSGVNTTTSSYSTGTICDLKFTPTMRAQATRISDYFFASGHPVVASLTGLPATKNTHSAGAIQSQAIDSGNIGVALSSHDNSTLVDEIVCFAIEAGTNDLTSPAPVPVGARVVVLGFLYSTGVITWTADAISVISNSITWALSSSVTYSLSAASGSYADTGQAVNLVTPKKIAPAQGAYALTGQNATLSYNPGGVITIDGSYERSSYNPTGSSVTGTGSSALIEIQPRYHHFEGTGTRWLEFGLRVTGVDTYTPTFKVLDYASGSCHAYGWWGTNKREMYSYDRETWHYFDNQTVVAGSYIEFSNSSPFTQNVVYVTRSRQITVTQMGEWLEDMAAAHAYFTPSPTAVTFTPSTTTSFPAQSFIADEYTTQTDDLGRTVPAVPYYAAVINDTSLMPSSGTKKIAVINGGTHAGEDLGDWAMQRFVEWLCSSATEAQEARRHYKIYLYPLLNASGRHGGGSRGSFAASGSTDANRHFSDASPTLDLVVKPRAVMVADLGADDPVWMFDFHGTYRGIFNMYIDTGNALQAEFQTRIDALFTGYTVPDEGEQPTGSVSYYFENTQNAELVMIFEHGDTTVTADSDYVDWADAIGKSLNSLRVDGLITGAGAGYSMTAAQGSYSDSGQSAGLRASRKLSLAQGAYADTGQAAALRAARKVAMAQGAYNDSGYAAALTYSGASAPTYTVAIGQGSYSLGGQAAALKINRSISAVSGSYADSGQAALLRKASKLTLVQGSYSDTGNAVRLVRACVLTVVRGSYVDTGYSVSLTFTASGSSESSISSSVLINDLTNSVMLLDSPHAVSI